MLSIAAISLLFGGHAVALRSLHGAAPAAAPGPAGPADQTKSTVHCQFTIRNLDYDEVMEHEEADEGVRSSIKKMIDAAAELAIASGPGPGPAPAPSPGPAGNPPAAPALLQLGATRAGRGPAPGPAPVASPMAAPGPGPAPDLVDTFVVLSEGRHDAVQVDAYVHPPPEFLPKVEGAVQTVCKDHILANALVHAEGISWAEPPVIMKVSVGNEEIARWGLDCGPHVKEIIDRFLMAYTRAQVPHALDAACHLFESKISFSGNNRITKWDRKACKVATDRLMKKWKYGKGKVVDSESDWCHDICESKMGTGHPMCHFGDEKGDPVSFGHPGAK